MTKFVAKRVRFQNGERHSVLSRPGALPVHEATLYLAKCRKRGLAANTIHSVCMALALLHRELAKANIDLLERLRQGKFLTVPELNRLVDVAQYRVDDLSYEDADELSNSTVVDIRRIRMRRKAAVREVKAVGVASQATRLRYMANYLEFLATYSRIACCGVHLLTNCIYGKIGCCTGPRFALILQIYPVKKKAMENSSANIIVP